MLLWALGGAALAWIGLRILQPVAILWHELGHALSALVLSRDDVGLDVGRFEGSCRSVGRLRYRLSPAAASGRTVYEAGRMTRLARTGVALGGPIASVAGGAVGVYFGLQSGLEIWLRFAAFVFGWAHLRVFLFTSLPFRGRTTDAAAAGGGHAPDVAEARGGDWRDLRAIWTSGDPGMPIDRR